LLDALQTARDTARVRAHLLSSEAREQWGHLQERLDGLQSSVEASGDKVSQATVKGVEEITQAIRELLHDAGPATSLAVSAESLMKPAQGCPPEETLLGAAKLMWELDCGSVPVTVEGSTLVGMITDRDICMAAYTRGQPLEAMTVSSAMSKEVASAAPDTPATALLTQMSDKRLRRIPVARDGKLLGIVSLADVVRHVASANDAAAALRVVATLAAISEPASR